MCKCLCCFLQSQLYEWRIPVTYVHTHLIDRGQPLQQRSLKQSRRKRAAATHPCGRVLQSPAKACSGFYDRGGTSGEWLLLSWQRPGFSPICCTNGQSWLWPFPSGASARTVHCLKQGACLQSDITITVAASAAACWPFLQHESIK